MKKIMILMFSLSIAACSSSDSGSGSDNTQSTSIVGTWSFIYPTVQCTETYIFNSNNTFSATSLDEIFGGTYSLTNEANASNRQPFTITITSDNQQADCEGDTDSEIGLVAGFFIEFVTATEMDWYEQSSGGIAAVTLNKN